MKRTNIYRMSIAVIAIIVLLGIALAAPLHWSAGRSVIAKKIESAVGSVFDGIGGDARLNLSLGTMDVPSLTGVGFKDVEITMGDERGLLKIPYVKFTYNPLRVLFLGKTQTSAISGLELVEPELTLHRRSDGSWNISVLLPLDNGFDSNLLASAEGSLKIVDGILNITGVEGLKATSGRVDGTIHAHKGVLSSSGLKISIGSNHFSWSGKLDIKKRLVDTRFKVDSAEVSDLLAVVRSDGPSDSDCLTDIRAEGLIKGSAELKGNLDSVRLAYSLSGKQLPMEFSGETGLGRVILATLKTTGVYDASGLNLSTVDIASGTGRLHARGAVNADGVLSVKGDFRSSALEKEWPGLAAALKWTEGEGRLHFDVKGNIDNPIIEMDIMAPKAVMFGLSGSDLKAEMALSNSRLSITNGFVTVGGESLAVQGILGLGDKVPLTNLSLRIDDADIAGVISSAVGKTSPETLSAESLLMGRFSGAVAITAEKDAVTGTDLVCRGRLSAPGLVYKGFEMTNLETSIEYDGKSIEFSDGVVGIGDAQGRFSGYVANRQGVIDYSIDGFQLAELGKIDTSLEMSGIAAMSGQLAIDRTAISSTGNLTAKSLEYCGIVGDKLTAKYAYNSACFSVNDVIITRGSAIYRGWAHLNNLGSLAVPKLDAQFQVAGESLSGLLAMAGGNRTEGFGGIVDRSGSIAGSVSATGPIDSVKVDIDAGAVVRLVIENGRTRINSIKLWGLG